MLGSQIGQSWTGGVFRCPNYRGITIQDTHTYSIGSDRLPVNLGSYGWNVSGINGTPFPALASQFGLGFNGFVVPESAVRAPSDMIALGDGNLFVKPAVSDMNAMFNLNATETLFAYDILAWIYGRKLGWQPEYQGKVLQEIRRRHNGLYNMAFCDGHVEGIRHDRLFERSDRAARRWNSDNQPHLDLAPAD